MSLDMLLQILRALEGLAAEIAFMRFQGHMNANMRRNVVAFDGRGSATAPLTSQIQIVRALTTDMTLANMFLKDNQSHIHKL